MEMDACIMHGGTMEVGAITGVQDIFHPITLARRVMEKTPYNFLGNKGAMELAKAEGFKFLKPGTLVTEYARAALDRWLISQGINATGKADVGEELKKNFIRYYRAHFRLERETPSVQLQSTSSEISQRRRALED